MLNQSDLSTADILLSTGTSGTSRAIRAMSGSRYSHAALYIGNGEIIEAIGAGVVRQDLSRAMADDTLVSVYRRLRMSSAQANMVVRYATSQIGKPYDEMGALGGGATSTGRGGVITVFASWIIAPVIGVVLVGADVVNRINPESSFYCSELVALAFDHANVSLGSGAASTTPGDISSAHVLNFIGHLKQP